jgi:hypothetical protein
MPCQVLDIDVWRKTYGLWDISGSLRNHTVRQSAKQLSISLRTCIVYRNHVAEEDSPEIVLPILGEVLLKAHGSLRLKSNHLSANPGGISGAD